MLRTMWWRKASAANSKHQHVAFALDLEAAQLLHRGARLALGCAERAEVVHPEQVRSCLPHRLEVQRVVMPAEVAVMQARPLGAVEQQIAVGSAARLVAGVESRRRPGAPSVTAMVRGSSAFTPRTQAVSGRRATVSKCTT